MKLLLLDNSLKSFMGHSYEYDSSIIAEFRRRGFEVAVYGHKEMNREIIKELGAIPIFPRADFEGVMKPPFSFRSTNILFGNMLFRGALSKLPLPGPPGTEIVFFPNVAPTALLGILSWWRKRGRCSNAICLVLLRYDVDTNFYGYVFRLALPLARALGKSVVLLSDSTALAREYAAMAGTTVEVVPIPHTPKEMQKEGGGTRRETVLLFPGTAREDKGFLLLPAAVEYFLDRRMDLRFLIQAVSQVFSRKIPQAVARLKGFGDRVEVFENLLSHDEYEYLFRRADGVMLPYDVRDYRGRTSGVFAEAMANGKPAIATRCPWMEENINRYGFGVLIDEPAEVGIIRGIEEFLEKFARFREMAGDVSMRWRQEHNPRTFVDRILEICESRGMNCSGTPNVRGST